MDISNDEYLDRVKEPVFWLRTFWTLLLSVLPATSSVV